MIVSSTADSTQSTENLTGMAGRAVRSGGAMFVAKGVRFAFLFIVNVLLINLLLPADFGMMRYVLLTVGVANLLNEMGLTTAIVQKDNLDASSLWSLFCISSLWGAILYAAIFLISAPLARFFATPELTRLLQVGALVIPVAGISAVQRAWLRRRLEYGKLALVEMVAAAVSSIVSVALAFAGYGVWALVAGTLLFEGTISCTLLIICRIPVSRMQSFGALRALLFFGLAIVVQRLADYMLCNIPHVVIGKVIGNKGLGLFSVARDLALFPQMAINAVLPHVLISTFSRFQNDDKKTTAGFSRLLLCGSLLAVPVLVVMAVMPGEFLQVLCILKKNSAWIEAAPLLRWLAIMGMFYVFTTFSSSIWLSRGKVVESISVSVAVFLTVIIAIAIGEQWGLNGITCALVIQSVAIFLPYVYVNYRLIRVPVAAYIVTLLPSLVAGAFMAALLYAIHSFAPGDNVAQNAVALFGGAVFGGALYCAIVWMFFRSSWRQMMDVMRMLLPG